MSDSYLDRWAPWHDDAHAPPKPTAHGDTQTFWIAAEFLAGCPVEDWGCGLGFFRSIYSGPYVGVDGTNNRWVDVVADLRFYQSQTPGLFMRGVLEHNPDWRRILANAISSAEHKLVLVVFTPDGTGEELARTVELDVPDLALPHAEIMAAIRAAGFEVERKTLATSSAYGEETAWLCRK